MSSVLPQYFGEPNTKEKGHLSFIVFKKLDEELYTAVCLELNIVGQHDDRHEAMKNIETAAFEYVKSVLEDKAPDSLLNRPAPEKYWKISELIKQQTPPSVSRTEEAIALPSAMTGYERFPTHSRSLPERMRV